MIKLFKEFITEANDGSSILDGTKEDIVKYIITSLLEKEIFNGTSFWLNEAGQLYIIQSTDNFYMSKPTRFTVVITLDDYHHNIKKKPDEELYNKLVGVYTEISKIALNSIFVKGINKQEIINKTEGKEIWYKYFDLFDSSEKIKLIEFLIKNKNIYDIDDEWIDENKHYIRGNDLLWDLKTKSTND